MESKEIGDLLLQGWVMLGESCPKGCCVPMMLNKKSGIRVCVSCSKTEAQTLKSNTLVVGQPQTGSFQEVRSILKETIFRTADHIKTLDVSQGLELKQTIDILKSLAQLSIELIDPRL